MQVKVMSFLPVIGLHNFIVNLAVEEFRESVYICRRFDQNSSVLFLWDTVFIFVAAILWRSLYWFSELLVTVTPIDAPRNCIVHPFGCMHHQLCAGCENFIDAVLC